MSLRLMTLVALIVFPFGFFGCVYWDMEYHYTEEQSADEFRIFPNKPLLIHAEISDGEIISLEKIINEEANGNTISFKLSNSKNTRTVLSIKSELSVPVKYDLEIIDYKGKRHYTSSCPVSPGIRLLEAWGHPIPGIRVSNFRLLDKNDSMACK